MQHLKNIPKSAKQIHKSKSAIPISLPDELIKFPPQTSFFVSSAKSAQNAKNIKTRGPETGNRASYLPSTAGCQPVSTVPDYRYHNQVLQCFAGVTGPLYAGTGSTVLYRVQLLQVGARF